MDAHNDQTLTEHRVQRSILAAPEKRALLWLAHRLPRRITPDMLTLLGLLAMAGIGVAYYFAARHWLFLAAASLGLVINWFGDSLDGTLARVRKIERPKYGYYLDHLVDALGASFMLFGLAYSGLVSQPLCFAVLTLYLVMSINVYLATHTLGIFKISYARLSTTEGRIFLIALNLVLIYVKDVQIFEHTVLILDIICALAAVFLCILTIRTAVINLAALDRNERGRWDERRNHFKLGRGPFLE